jgi:hypothetical protein
MTRTSTSHPIRIDWLLSARESTEIPGRLGLAFAPGKCADGITGPWQRDLALDLAGLRKAGTEVLVCLLGDEELAHLGIPGLPASASAQGLDFRQFPIVDGDAPGTASRADELVELLGNDIRAGSQRRHPLPRRARSRGADRCVRLVATRDLPRCRRRHRPRPQPPQSKRHRNPGSRAVHRRLRRPPTQCARVTFPRSSRLTPAARRVRSAGRQGMSTHDRQLGLRLPRVVLERLDRLAEQLRQERPALRLSPARAGGCRVRGAAE